MCFRGEMSIMTKWEYNVRWISHYSVAAKTDLDRMGKEGWELVAIDDGVAYTKRMLEDE